MEKLKPTTPHPKNSKADFSPRGALAPPSPLTEPLRVRSHRRAWPVMKTMRLPVGRIHGEHPLPYGRGSLGVTNPDRKGGDVRRMAPSVNSLKVRDLQTCLMESKRLDPPPPTAQHGNRQPPIALRARKSEIALAS